MFNLIEMLFIFFLSHFFFRFAPPMAVLTALEFLWPFAGSGPIFSRVANFVVKKCTKNWWFNLLFINNALDAIDIVSYVNLF